MIPNSIALRLFESVTEKRIIAPDCPFTHFMLVKPNYLVFFGPTWQISSYSFDLAGDSFLRIIEVSLRTQCPLKPEFCTLSAMMLLLLVEYLFSLVHSFLRTPELHDHLNLMCTPLHCLPSHYRYFPISKIINNSLIRKSSNMHLASPPS